MARTIKKMPMSDSMPYVDKAVLINSLVDVLKWISPFINPACGQLEPPAELLYDGLLALANGVEWDPAGDGTKGLFRYNTSTAAWVYVG